MIKNLLHKWLCREKVGLETHEVWHGRVYKPVNSNDWKFRELIHTKVPVGNYHAYLSQIIQAAITAQSCHPGDNTQGL